jgi:hypothetical protein
MQESLEKLKDAMVAANEKIAAKFAKDQLIAEDAKEQADLKCKNFYQALTEMNNYIQEEGLVEKTFIIPWFKMGQQMRVGFFFEFKKDSYEVIIFSDLGSNGEYQVKLGTVKDGTFKVEAPEEDHVEQAFKYNTVGKNLIDDSVERIVLVLAESLSLAVKSEVSTPQEVQETETEGNDPGLTLLR